MTIAAGDFVRLKQDPTRAGVVQEDEKRAAGRRMVQVRFSDGQVKWLPDSALELVPSSAESVLDRFSAGRFVEPDWLRRTLTRLRVAGRLSNVVYSMEATETDFYAYQFKPVIKLMGSPTDALLIGDEVGLGKTIEAGLVWTELRARLECDRLLVVCPKTLCQKWQDELANRFGVEAQIGNAGVLLRALQQARDNKRGYALVCSMQGLRPPKGWDHEERGNEAPKASARLALARLLDEASDGEPLIDLLVVDEAHHMRNPETLINRFGGLVNSVASYRLFLSATPIHLRNRDLHSLLRMVDRDTFEFEYTLDDLIATNAPVIAARDLLLRADAPVSEVLEQLDEAQGHEILRRSRALAQIRQAVTRADLDRSKRSELASRLERVNQLANYVTRTRRRDVQEFRVLREPKAPILSMSSDERRFYDEITEVVKDYALDQEVNELFLLSTPQRLLTSSLAAASAYWCELARTKRSRGLDPIEETDSDIRGESFNDRPLLARLTKCALRLDMTERLADTDTKYELLLRELRQLWDTDDKAKIIVFSSFKPTLRYLRGRLRGDGVETELLHGSVSRPRMEILKRFQQDDEISVLLSSEVGSEGVDLQFSSIVVNYDLPWNPMRLEQRIGRVDRLGQKREKVTILNLIHDDTIDKRIYDRLYERLEIGQRALGEMEAVLGQPIRNMQLQLLDPALNDSQREKIIDQTAQALENLRREEAQLESEAGSLVQHGDYILERIMESRERHLWLSGDDVLTYVRDRVLHEFPGSVIETSPPGSETYRIDLSSEGVLAFQSYLARRGLKGRTRLLNGNPRQRYRFTSSVVHKGGVVENISQLHPLVRFSAERELEDEKVREAQAVAATLDSTLLPSGLECASGLYVLAARRWSIGNTATFTLTNVRVGYAGAEARTGKLIPADLAERMVAAAADQGRSMLNASRHADLDTAAKTLKDVVLPELDRRFGDFVDQAQAEIEDRIEIRLSSLARHFEGKTAMLEAQRSRLDEQALLAESSGNDQRARNLRNLAKARQVMAKKLRRTWELRRGDLDAQRSATPEETDILCAFVCMEP